MATASVSFPESTIPLPADKFLRRLFSHRLAIMGLAIILALIGIALYTAVADRVDPKYAYHSDPQAPQPNGLGEMGQPHPPGMASSPLADNTVVANSDDPQNAVSGNPPVPQPDESGELSQARPRSKGFLFLLGADTLGRDVWTRTLHGTRISLLVAFCAMITAVLFGTTIGLIGGYFGGWVDVVITRITEAVMSLPTVLLAITLLIVIPGETYNARLFKLLLAIAVVTWTGIARAVRGQVLSLKEQEFIEAARAVGGSHARIIFVHLLPNVLPTVIVLATLATAHNILLEAGLSYLGMGMEAGVPSWGGMISEGQPYLLSAPWITLAPGGFNLLGQALQETLEPRP
jgi:peptide/nickel transport system permease protein